MKEIRFNLKIYLVYLHAWFCIKGLFVYALFSFILGQQCKLLWQIFYFFYFVLNLYKTQVNMIQPCHKRYMRQSFVRAQFHHLDGMYYLQFVRRREIYHTYREFFIFQLKYLNILSIKGKHLFNQKRERKVISELHQDFHQLFYHTICVHSGKKITLC